MLIVQYDKPRNKYFAKEPGTKDPVTEFTFDTEEKQLEFIQMFMKNQYAAKYAYTTHNDYFNGVNYG